MMHQALDAYSDDQMRKDGISEPMIQALYYDFVTNYVKTRMYSTRYVECNSGDTIPCEVAKVHLHIARSCLLLGARIWIMKKNAQE